MASGGGGGLQRPQRPGCIVRELRSFEQKRTPLFKVLATPLNVELENENITKSSLTKWCLSLELRGRYELSQYAHFTYLNKLVEFQLPSQDKPVVKTEIFW